VCSLFRPALGAKVGYVKAANRTQPIRKQGLAVSEQPSCIQTHFVVQVLSMISGNFTTKSKVVPVLN
jgi:hypothetical protein